MTLEIESLTNLVEAKAQAVWQATMKDLIQKVQSLIYQ